MKITKDRLLAKGWSDDEIDKTIEILQKKKQELHPISNFLDKTVYWLVLFISIIGNIVFSLVLIPLIITMNNISLYFIVLILSISFGVLMSIIIKDIENLQTKHHIGLLAIIPIVGIINFFIVVKAANNIVTNLNELVSISVLHHYIHPILLGVVYIIGFLIPYFYLVHEEKWTKR